MADVLDEIQREIRENKVVLYMKGTPSFPMCGFSAATVKVLREIGVPFKAVDVLAEPEKREAIKVHSSWPTIPQLYVDGKFVGGCDIVREMHGRGGLAPLIRAAVQAACSWRRTAAGAPPWGTLRGGRPGRGARPPHGWTAQRSRRRPRRRRAHACRRR